MERKKRVIPMNIYPNALHYRNIIETVVMEILVLGIIVKIPFVRTAKIIFLICAAIAVAFIFLRGIHRMSITEAISKHIMFAKNRRKAHLRSIDYVKRKKNGFLDETQGASTVDKLINLGRERGKRWKAELREKIITDLGSGESGDGKEEKS